jgi:hypothetical protein
LSSTNAGSTIINPTTTTAALARLNHPLPFAEAQIPAVSATNIVFIRTIDFRTASLPVTPPAKIGIIKRGAHATSAQNPVSPADVNFPSNTSKLLTRVRKSRINVPSRRSELMTSAVSKHAPQQNRNVPAISPVKTPLPTSAGPPDVPQTNPGTHTNTPAITTPNRVQCHPRLRARTRNSRSTIGRKVMRQTPKFEFRIPNENRILKSDEMRTILPGGFGAALGFRLFDFFRHLAFVIPRESA